MRRQIDLFEAGFNRAMVCLTALAAVGAHDCRSPFYERERPELALMASALVVVERAGGR